MTIPHIDVKHPRATAPSEEGKTYPPEDIRALLGGDEMIAGLSPAFYARL